MGNVPPADKVLRGTGIEFGFAAWEKGLKSYLARYFHRREDIDDMAQDTYLLAHEATRGRSLAFPQAYLYKVARNVALSKLSCKMRQLTDYLEEVPVAQPGSQGGIDEELIAEQAVALYCEAIEKLPPQRRKVFLMRKIQGLSHKEIAAKLGITPRTVESHITRGLVQFRDYIDNSENSGQVRNDAVPRRAKNPGGV